ncbi:SusC/RagA family TonB-linked outer membrane protein [Riemerella anatipestifer]|uniref:SusC/RagA family TonB-linked outer membrane protein n=1 Tax=Riemerella anatipestifer TaxID=34085 RepID=UPI001C6E6E74|nr:SusC/RagA family TonB-linked outer membrane protein [Riemerella anatipestifer]QYQ96157.1 SusC/RagA family TonB-linked outer membrane protein [Riemerella anatipestifer]
MNVKLRVLTAGAVFFIGAQSVVAQKTKKDSVKTREIEEVVMVGYGVQKKSEVTASISKIKGGEIADLNTPSFEAQLAGRAAGVQVTQNTGVLGSAPRVRIRGVNSISSGTSPLYVIDGVPMISGDTGGGYASSNALADINPNDIESMEVLKDGAAAAIYGSRAANGVILITTKKGKGGKFTFNYNNLLSIASPVKYFDLLKTNDFLAISAEKVRPYGLPGNYWAEGAEFDTDWQKAVTRSSLQQDHYLSFGGGLAKGKYFMSLGYTDQEGVILQNSMRRFTVRANVDQKLTDRVDVGGNFSVSKTDFAGINNGANTNSGVMNNALRQLPNTPVFDPSTPTGYNITNESGKSFIGRWTNNANIANDLPNIVYVLNNNRMTSELTRILGNVYTNVKFTDWLTYRLQASVDNSITDGRLYYNKVHGDGFSREGVVEGNNLNLLRWNLQNTFTVDKSFNDHKVNLTLVHEEQYQKARYIFGGGTGLAADYFGKDGPVTNSYKVQSSGGSITENALTSYIARFNYNYARKYFLQASIRRDGLSQLPSETRWGTFPGLSVGWTVSNEKFMEALKPTLSDFKLKASYAKVGNTDIGNYPFRSLYGNARYADNTGLALVQAGNPNLKWETSVKYDYGVELGFFRNRLTFTADYFINNQDGIILDRPTSPILGIPGNTISQNIGSSKNSGFEFSLNADVIRKDNFSWSIGSNVSFVNNEVTGLVSQGSDIFYNIDSGREQVGIIRVGESIRSIYGYKYWGVNKQNGNPVYYKTDGSLVQHNINDGKYYVFDLAKPSSLEKASTLTSADKQILGRTLPKYFGSFSTNIKWKNFDLSTLVRFSGGNKILNLTRRNLLSMDFYNNSTEILGRWQSLDNPGDGMTPRIVGSKGNIINMEGVATSRFVEDGSFIKIDNINFGYSLPKDLVNSFGMTNLRIFASVQNAFVFTKYSGMDPELEVNGVDYNNAPRQRTYSLGLNLSF